MLTTKKIKKNTMILFKSEEEIKEFLENYGKTMFDSENPESNVQVVTGSIRGLMKSEGDKRLLACLTSDPEEVSTVAGYKGTWDVAVYKENKKPFLVNLDLSDSEDPVATIKKMYDKKW